MAGYIGNKAVGINVTTGDIRGDVGVGGDVTATTSDGAILNLNSSDTTITDGSVLGAIKFTAPLEGSGTDSVLLGAAIEAVAEATFAADNNATELVFKTGASAAADQKMVLTSGGDLLVGMTSASTNNDGAGIRANGLIHAKRADVVALFNRKSSDGVTVQFAKDNTVFGTIGNEGVNLQISGVGSTLNIGGSNSVVWPDLDNSKDLGVSNYRFKDLYLSGGAFIGGTGAANKLDDYEEGTWTPILASGSHSYSEQTGKYTKIGNQITIWGRMMVSSRGSTTAELGIGGLPIASGGTPFASTFGMLNIYGTAGLLPEAVLPTGGSIEGSIAYLRNQFATNNSYTYNSLNSSGGWTFAFTYRTG